VDGIVGTSVTLTDTIAQNTQSNFKLAQSTDSSDV
jgi:hypothetical protein